MSARKGLGNLVIVADGSGHLTEGHAALIRTALRDAASVAGLLVTTEAMIADKPEKKDAMPGGGIGGMGGMDF